MIRVSFREPRPDPEDPWYERWQARAERETATALGALAEGLGKEYQPRRGLWGVKKLKRHLIELFRGKCAYCESRLLHVTWGDVEHYRPKKAVAEDPAHGGYYWLAYDLRNLLLACPRCNGAKMNQFPVRGRRACAPEDIEQEKPLLLNPYHDDPRHHLRFYTGRDGELWGDVEGVSEEGRVTVRICNLRREELISQRRKAQELVVLRLALALDRWRAAVTASMLGQGSSEAAVRARQQIDKEIDLVGRGGEELSASMLAAAAEFLERALS